MGTLSIILALSALVAYGMGMGFKPAPDGLTPNYWELYSYIAALLALALSFGANSYRVASMVVSGATIAALIGIFAYKVWQDQKSWTVVVFNLSERPIIVESIEPLTLERPDRAAIGKNESGVWRQGTSPVPRELTIIWSFPGEATARTIIPVPSRPRDAYGTVTLTLHDGAWKSDWSFM